MAVGEASGSEDLSKASERYLGYLGYLGSEDLGYLGSEDPHERVSGLKTSGADAN